MKKQNKKLFVSIILVITVLALSGLVFAILNQEQPPNNAPSQENTTLTDEEEPLDYTTAPPTEAEKEAGQAKKDQILEDAGQNQQSEQSEKSSVKPIISTWSKESETEIKISGFVPGVVDSGGICELTIYNDSGQKAVIKRDARPDAQTTLCGTFIYDNSLKGQLTMELYYSSPEYMGKSDRIPLEVK